jgi:hypothetical protein
VVFSTARNACSTRRLSPPEDSVGWEKGHGRLDRRSLVRVPVSPEEIGLCGCWQVIVVRRQRVEMGLKASEPSEEISCYATSLGRDQLDDAELIEVIRGHWAAIENGSHYRRDVSLGEDASRVSKRGAAQVMATLRNLAIGLYELEQERQRTRAPGLKSWCRQMTVSVALQLLCR